MLSIVLYILIALQSPLLCGRRTPAAHQIWVTASQSQTRQIINTEDTHAHKRADTAPYAHPDHLRFCKRAHCSDQQPAAAHHPATKRVSALIPQIRNFQWILKEIRGKLYIFD